MGFRSARSARFTPSPGEFSSLVLVRVFLQPCNPFPDPAQFEPASRILTKVYRLIRMRRIPQNNLSPSAGATFAIKQCFQLSRVQVAKECRTHRATRAIRSVLIRGSIRQDDVGGSPSGNAGRHGGFVGKPREAASILHYGAIGSMAAVHIAFAACNRTKTKIPEQNLSTPG